MKTVLVADDRATSRELVRTVLEKSGSKVALSMPADIAPVFIDNYRRRRKGCERPWNYRLQRSRSI